MMPSQIFKQNLPGIKQQVLNFTNGHIFECSHLFPAWSGYDKTTRQNLGKMFKKRVIKGEIQGVKIHYEPPENSQDPIAYIRIAPPGAESAPPAHFSMPDTKPEKRSVSRTQVFFGVAALIAVIVAIAFLARNCGSGTSALTDEDAIDKIKNFAPSGLDITIGEMLGSISENGAWTAHISDNTIWEVRFFGGSEKGSINATFTITRDGRLEYRSSVDGRAMALDVMYRFFHDPDYETEEQEKEAAAAREQDETGERMIRFVQDHTPGYFGGMTILEFLDSVCGSGEWEVNDRAARLRVVYEGAYSFAGSDNTVITTGRIQAIFTVDEAAGAGILAEYNWYHNSADIEAADLYRMFYP